MGSGLFSVSRASDRPASPRNTLAPRSAAMVARMDIRLAARSDVDGRPAPDNAAPAHIWEERPDPRRDQSAAPRRAAPRASPLGLVQRPVDGPQDEARRLGALAAQLLMLVAF